MEEMNVQSAQELLNMLIKFGTDYGLKIIGAILILVIGRIAAGIGRKLIKKGLEKAKTEPAIVSFVGSLIYVAILTFAVLAALARRSGPPQGNGTAQSQATRIG